MSGLLGVFKSSIGRKLIMALTGLFLCGFLVGHLSGNFLLLIPDGGRAFNEYAVFMSTTWYIRIAEIGLALGILFHILDAVLLTRANRAARGRDYDLARGDKNSSWFSRNMGLTGFMLLLFLGLHLKTFFWAHRIEHATETMYETVARSFAMPWYSAIYIVAFVILGMHLHHGFQSAFQSLGANHPKYTPLLKRLGTLFAVAIVLGYSVIPLYFLSGAAAKLNSMCLESSEGLDCEMSGMKSGEHCPLPGTKAPGEIHGKDCSMKSDCPMGKECSMKSDCPMTKDCLTEKDCTMKMKNDCPMGIGMGAGADSVVAPTTRPASKGAGVVQ